MIGGERRVHGRNVALRWRERETPDTPTHAAAPRRAHTDLERRCPLSAHFTGLFCCTAATLDSFGLRSGGYEAPPGAVPADRGVFTAQD